MILVDTNVISEMMKPAPAAKVVNWIDQPEVIQLYISTVTIAEISYGINVLPDGNRRTLLDDSFNKVLKDAFEYRILSFDEVATQTRWDAAIGCRAPIAAGWLGFVIFD